MCQWEVFKRNWKCHCHSSTSSVLLQQTLLLIENTKKVSFRTQMPKAEIACKFVSTSTNGSLSPVEKTKQKIVSSSVFDCSFVFIDFHLKRVSITIATVKFSATLWLLHFSSWCHAYWACALCNFDRSISLNASTCTAIRLILSLSSLGQSIRFRKHFHWFEKTN